jgi:transaldolase
MDGGFIREFATSTDPMRTELLDGQSEPRNDSNRGSNETHLWRRIDVLVDQLLQHRMAQKNGPAQALMGKAAVANAKLAYQSFKNIFSSSRWKKLEEKGARVQRPLWASTSTENPQYSDVCYVEPLIGPNTVNTMPEETIAAFADHGRVRENTVEEDVVEAADSMADLEKPVPSVQ